VTNKNLLIFIDSLWFSPEYFSDLAEKVFREKKGRGIMNQAALKKHEIYQRLIEFPEHDLNELLVFLDFLQYRQHRQEKSALHLEGVLSDYSIDFSELQCFKHETWKHVEEEHGDGELCD
jgi:hypothetical protein